MNSCPWQPYILDKGDMGAVCLGGYMLAQINVWVGTCLGWVHDMKILYLFYLISCILL